MADLYGNTNGLQNVLIAVNDAKDEVSIQADLLEQILEALKIKSGSNVNKFNEYFTVDLGSGYFDYNNSSCTLRYTEIETTSDDNSGIAPAVVETYSASVLLTANKDMNISFDYLFNINPNADEGISTAVVVSEMGAQISVITADETIDIFNDDTIQTGSGSWSGELSVGNALRLRMITGATNSSYYVKLSNMIYGGI